MIFGPMPTGEAEGCLLAHSLRGAGFTFKKGRRLSADDIAALAAAGIAEVIAARLEADDVHERSEEHTSELQSLMRISYAVFCLKKKTNKNTSAQTEAHLDDRR